MIAIAPAQTAARKARRSLNFGMVHDEEGGDGEQSQSDHQDEIDAHVHRISPVPATR